MTHFLKSWFTEFLSAALGWTILLIPVWFILPNAVPLIALIKVILYLSSVGGVVQLLQKRIAEREERVKYQRWREEIKHKIYNNE